MYVEELLESGLADASNLAAGVVPDVVTALDELMPRLLTGGDRAAVRRYWSNVHAAVQALTELPARDPGALPSASVVFELLRRDTANLPWVAPSADGLGVITVLVDRLRGMVAGVPQRCVRTPADIDEHELRWFLKVIDEVGYEHERASPLRRAMATLDLSSTDVAQLMGVTRQAVDKWLVAGPPADRSLKIGAMAEIADILRHRLRDGMPAIVARRPAEAYGNRTMLELLASDEHEWLLESVRNSFDFARTA